MSLPLPVFRRYPSTKFGPPHIDMLRRVIGTTDINGKGTSHPVERQADPFFFLDEASIPPGVKPPFGAHPHTGLVAVSCPINKGFRGMLWDNHYSDSNAEYGPLCGGGILQIKSGKGIVHDEGRACPGELTDQVKKKDSDKEEPGWMLQCWFNPGIGGSFNRELEPAERHLFEAKDIPEIIIPNFLRIRVLMGEYGGKRSPAKLCDAELVLLDVEVLESGDSPSTVTIDLPGNFSTAWVYNLRGNSCTGGRIQVLDSGSSTIEDSENSSNSDSTTNTQGPTGLILNEQEIGIRENSSSTTNIDSEKFKETKLEIKGLTNNTREISDNLTSDSVTVTVTERLRPRFFVGAGKPHGLPWVKLLGNDGALIGPTEEFVRSKMKEYEELKNEFGK